MRGPIEALHVSEHGPLVHSALFRPVTVRCSTRFDLAAVIGDLTSRFGQPTGDAQDLTPARRAPLGFGPRPTEALGLDYVDEATRDLTIVRPVPGIQRGRAAVTLTGALQQTDRGTELRGSLTLSPECRFGTEAATAVVLVATLWGIAGQVAGAIVIGIFFTSLAVVSWTAATRVTNCLITDLSEALRHEPVEVD